MDKKIGAIENGINLDHIPQGNAWLIIRLLKLGRRYPMGIGLNLVSKRIGFKDLVKIENYYLTDNELAKIRIFAHGATYSEIKNYEIVKKIQLTRPELIEDIIICPNHRCISHEYKSLFKIQSKGEHIMAKCHYCECNYDMANLTQFKL